MRAELVLSSRRQRGEPKLQQLSLSHTRAGRELPENTRGLLLFSQGGNYRGKGLVGEEAKAMDKLLAQLEPECRKWQAAEEDR